MDSTLFRPGSARPAEAVLDARRPECIVAAGVVVEVSETTGNARLGKAAVKRMQTSDTAVAISASVGVSELLVRPAEVRFRVRVKDRCSRRSDRSFFVLIEDPASIDASAETEWDVRYSARI